MRGSDMVSDLVYSENKCGQSTDPCGIPWDCWWDEVDIFWSYAHTEGREKDLVAHIHQGLHPLEENWPIKFLNVLLKGHVTASFAQIRQEN